MRRVSLFLSLAAMAIVSGCGGGDSQGKSQRPATVPAKGVVTYKDQPLTGAIVVIQPSEKDGIGASGLTDAEGKFELKAFPPDGGAVPGAYTGTVVKMDDSASSPTGEDANGRPVIQKSLIPEKYGNPMQSGLKVEISKDGNSAIQIDLKS